MLKYHGGRLLTQVELTAIYGRVKGLNPDGSVQPPTWVDPYGIGAGQAPLGQVCTINNFIRDLVSSAYIDLVSAEYSVPGGPQIGHGTLKASKLVELPFIRPANDNAFTIDYTDVEAMIESSIQSGLIPAPNANSCYLVFFSDVLVADPQSVIAGADSGGFHSMFVGKNGTKITYCVVDASDVGGINTTSHASHEMVEAITNPDHNGHDPGEGWYDDGAGKEIVDLCEDEDKQEVQFFHNSAVASIYLPSKNACGIPQPDNVLLPAPVIRISTTFTSRGCTGGIPGDTAIDFTVHASIGNNSLTFVKISWEIVGTAIIGAHDQLTCTVFTPPAGAQFTLTFTGIDEIGCLRRSDPMTFTCATGAQMAWAEELCKLRHLILKYWRFISPLWDPLRDFSTRPVDQRELRRMKELIRQMGVMVSLLERQPSASPSRMEDTNLKEQG